MLIKLNSQENYFKVLDVGCNVLRIDSEHTQPLLVMMKC